MLDKAARERGLQLRLRYEYLSADVADDPDAWEPDTDDLAAIEEELRAAVERMRTNDDWKGVADERLRVVRVPVDLPRQRRAGRALVAGARHEPTRPTPG